MFESIVTVKATGEQKTSRPLRTEVTKKLKPKSSTTGQGLHFKRCLSVRGWVLSVFAVGQIWYR